MKKKNWILPGLIAILIAACFLFVGFSSYNSAQKEKSTCSSQQIKDCTPKTNKPASGEMILDNLSRQFLSITTLGY
jgi:hypothetical protein